MRRELKNNCRNGNQFLKLSGNYVFLSLSLFYFSFYQLLASSESLCIEAFDMAWKIISSLSNTQLIFWSNLKAFVQFVFDTKVLTIAAKIKGQAYLKIKEVTISF